MFKVVVYKDTKCFTLGGHVKRTREEVSDATYSPKISSLNRTKTLIRDIILCNNFDYFCTFTFNPDRIDSFNFGRCYSAMSSWLHHQRDNSRGKGIEFRYLIVPELHKSGRWHFHALISGYTGRLRPSGCVTSTCRPIYNITSFRSGFTTAVAVDSADGVANYVSKYITKDFIKYFNQRRFFCSRNLSRPIKTVNSSILRNVLPLSKRLVCDNRETFEYVIDKDLLC